MYDIYNRGRWYKFFVESDGETVKLTSSDLEGTVITGNYIELPLDYNIVDFKPIVHTVAGGTTNNYALTIRMYSTGAQGVTLPTKTSYDYATIYIFAYKE